ncbi:ester cyclase [Duganella callida]|uniref:Ester cyclase n=1 Tax=Duganella callida TaxID=2561932 RepID=A0A4Y9SX46_9BURK|nr:ester cyclase [Duganella callida]TFW29213.1 ester cyclase [Duganella callida]
MKPAILASLLIAGAAHAEPVTDAARTYAAFWNTGDAALARQALSPDFIDRTLPAGRVQGVEGPLQASAFFRTAVPDLKAEATHIVPNGDMVSVRLHFSGHFTGKFGDVQGQGQTIDFQAFDLYHVVDGRIAENWHLEDNLTLMQQLGLIPGPQSAPSRSQ